MTTGTDHRARLESEALTDNQRGRIMAEFGRLGFHGTRDRDERLRLTAVLARRESLASVRDLTAGEAGRAIHALTGCATIHELYAVTDVTPGRWRLLAALRAWLGSPP